MWRKKKKTRRQGGAGVSFAHLGSVGIRPRPAAVSSSQQVSPYSGYSARFSANILRTQLLLLDESKTFELARELGNTVSEFLNTNVYTKRTRLVARMRTRKTLKNAYKRVEIWIPTLIARLMPLAFVHKKYMYLNHRALTVNDEFVKFVQDKLDDDYNFLPREALAEVLGEGFRDMAKGSKTHPIAKEITDAWFEYQQFDRSADPEEK